MRKDGKDGFVIYKKYYRPISKLSDKQLGRLFRAIFKYQLGEVVEIEEDIDMAFEFFKAQFELDEQKYQGIVERNRENGRRGGARRSSSLPDEGRDDDVEACGTDDGPEADAGGKGDRYPVGADGSETCDRYPVGAKEASGCDRYPVGANGSDRWRSQADGAYKEKDKDKEKDEKESTSDEVRKKAALSSPPPPEKIDYEKLKDYFNGFAREAGLAQVSKLTDVRKAAIRQRVAQYGKESIGAVMRKVVESDFLRGRNERGWQATFDWIFRQQHFTRILEGVYDNKNCPPRGFEASGGNVNDEWQ